MIGAALRLAGGALANPIGRQIIGGAAATGGVMAAPAVMDYATGKSKRSLQDRLILEGKDPEAGYDTNIIDRLLYGDAVSDEAIDRRKTKKESQANRQKYGDQLESVGGKFTEGMTGGQAAKELRRLTKAQERSDLVNDPIFQRQEKRYSDQQKDIAQTRLDQLQESRLARQDNIDARRDRLDFDRANLAFKEAESKRRFDMDSKRAHKEKIASIIAGLAGLGGAFAI